MTVAQRIPISSLSNGNIQIAGTSQPAANATAYVYQHGTTIQATVYAAETGGATLTQPLVADGNGQLPGWFAGGQDLDIVATYRGASATAALVEPQVASMVATVSSDAIGRDRVIVAPGGAGLRDFVSVKDSPFNATMDGVGDDGSAARAAYSAIGSKGTMYVPAGTLYCNTTGTLDAVLFSKNATGVAMVGAGMDATTLKLSSNTPSLAGFNKTGDGDIFQNHTLRDFTIDGNNVGGQHHGLIGNYHSGTIQTKIQYQNWNLENIRCINLPSPDATGTNDRRWINFWTRNDDTDTQLNCTDLHFRNVWLYGGAYGFQGVASTISGGTHYSNTQFDSITLANCHHDCNNIGGNYVPTGTVPHGGANFHFGSAGYGKSIRFTDCFGQNSPDVGTEVDGFTDCVGYGCRMIDGWGFAYYNTNFATIPGLNAQRTLWHGSKWRRSAQNTNSTSGSCVGWRSTTTANFTTQYPSQLSIRGCEGHDDTGNLKTLGDFITVDSTRRLIVNDFTIIHDGVTSTPSTGTLGAIKVRNGVGAGAMGVAHFELKDLKVHVNGTVSNTGFTYSPLLVSNTGESYTDLDGLDVDWTLTGASSTTYRGIQIGDSAAGQTSNGRIRKYRILQLSGDASPRMFVLNDTNWVTVPDKWEMTGCDFSKLAAGTEVVFSTPGGGSAQNGKVYAWGNRWHTNPAPSTLTGLTTATGAPLNTNTACIATFVQGSGTAITAIDYSTNGGTTYTSFLTQASGALPAGFSQSLGPLRPQDLIKVTFTGAQPTINLVPFNP